MQPVSPVITEEFVASEVVFAKDQPQYNPLPVIRRPDGVLLSRWKLTDEEREAIAAGADILLFNCTFNQPLQPVKIEVSGFDRSLMETARFMWVVDPPKQCEVCGQWVQEWIAVYSAVALLRVCMCETCAGPEQWSSTEKLHA
jgi:hypothetical protein